jgi:septum site-determining protein MinD
VRATRDETLTIEDVLEILAVPLLGVIPESQEVPRASNVGSPVTLSNKRSAPARAYVAAAKKLRNGAAVISIRGKSGLLSKWFGKSDNNLLKPCDENPSSTLVARAPA